MYSRSVCALLVGAFLLFHPVLAAGNGGRDDKKRAKKLFDEGVQLYRTGKFLEACARFEASLALYDGIGSRGKLAECYERVGRVANAWRLYREVERLSRRTGNMKRARVAAKRMKQLEARLARLVIEVEPSAEIAGLSIRHNGQSVDRESWGETLIVEAGQHTIRVSADGYQTWHERVRIGEGEAQTVAVPVLQPKGSGATVGSMWADDRAGDPGSRATRLVGYSLMGTGAATLVAGLVLGGNAYRYQSDLSGPCQRALALCNPAEVLSDEAAQTNAAWATYTSLAGTVLVVGGAVMWWLGRGSEPVANERAVRLRPALERDGAGLVLTGLF